MRFSQVSYIILISLYSVAAISSSGNSFLVSPQVCEVDTGANSCPIFISWDQSKTHCLFVKESQKKLACSTAEHISLAIKAGESKTLELRRGDYKSKYKHTQLLHAKIVTAVERDKDIEGFSFEDVQSNLRLNFNGAASAVSSSSWDGRLLFGTFGLGDGKIGMSVRTLRSERFEDANFKEKDLLNDRNSYSQVHIIDSDSLTDSEVADRLANAAARWMGGHKNLGKNRLNANHGFGLAVYPTNHSHDNPYTSDKDGNFTEEGLFHTYSLYGILPTDKAGSVESPLITNSRKRFFLSKFELKVVVKDPETKNSSIHQTKVISATTAMRDINGKLIHGYEASATLDGRMIVYSSNFAPTTNTIIGGGSVGYIYNEDSSKNLSWSKPNNLARMYYTDGPGSAAEKIIDGQKFSRLFPIAAEPIKEFDGSIFTNEDIITGSYPWVSFTGSEILFTPIPGFHGASRHGTTIVGPRTNWILKRVDGDMEATRGNITERFDIWNNQSDLNKSIKDGYVSMINPNTGSPFGRDGYMSVLNVSLGQFPSSWNALNSLSRSPLPHFKQRTTYGFIMAGNRYGEVHFPNYTKDLLLHYPMNEPYKFNKGVVNSFVIDPVKPNPEVYRRTGVTYQPQKTPDYSGNFQTGTLSGGAKYPFEYYNAKQRWRDKKEVMDRSEGAYGNSIVFPREGSLKSSLSEKSKKEIKRTQSFTVSFWSKLMQSSSLETQLFHIPNTLKISADSSKIAIEVTLNRAAKERTEKFIYPTNILTSRNWKNLTLTYRAGYLRLFLQGNLIMEKYLKRSINLSHGPSVLIVGPNGNAKPGQEVWIDEVFLYSISLPLDEIKNLAHKNKIRKTVTPDEAKTTIGKKLFVDPLLSPSGIVSCSTCHHSEGFNDSFKTSIGVNGKVGSRNTPSVVNSAFASKLHWDGSVGGLNLQALHPILNEKEMGEENLAAFSQRLKINYMDDFKRLEPNSREVSSANVSNILAHYIASLQTNNSSPLAFRKNKLSPSEDRGRRIFNGVANCTACHTGNILTDNKLHNISSFNSLEAQNKIFLSNQARSALKTPSLINVSKTAPYFHDGSLKTLEEVVDFYNRGGNFAESSSLKTAHNTIRPLFLNDNEKGDLVNYLQSLDREVSGEMITAPRTLPTKPREWIKPTISNFGRGCANLDCIWILGSGFKEHSEIRFYSPDSLKLIKTIKASELKIENNGTKIVLRISGEELKTLRLKGVYLDISNGDKFSNRILYAKDKYETPSISNLGRGCQRRDCIWIVGKNFDKHSVVNLYRNDQQAISITRASISVSKNGKVITFRLSGDDLRFSFSKGVQIEIKNGDERSRRVMISSPH